MLLLVGLGNPGPEYERNRHNIGFMAIDAIAERHGFPAFRSRFQGLLSEARIDGEKVLLLKPMTYMNRSGQAVGEAMRYYKLEPGRLLIVHDEMDLAVGKTKVKTGGGSAGHNGIRSIDSHLGTPDYRRLRLGVGHPGKDKATAHVLSDFSKADQPAVTEWIAAIAEHIGRLLHGDDSGYINELALATRDDAPEKTKKEKIPPPVKKEAATGGAPKSGLAAAFETALSKLRGGG